MCALESSWQGENQAQEVAQPRPPVGNRVSVRAVADGVFDLTDVLLYIPVGGRRREVTRRVLVDTIRQEASSYYSAMVYDECARSLEPIEMRGFSSLVVC